MYARGAVGYTTQFQLVIAHSATKVEFVACDTAKMILIHQSILYYMTWHYHNDIQGYFLKATMELS